MKHIKIYQILGNDDTSRDAKFSHYDGSVNSSLYEKVFDCEIEEEDLEDIFYRFNTSRHPLFFGHSLSVSDIVIKDGAAHYCDSYGWKHGIPFDETATKESKLDMRVIFVAPTMKPTVAYMPNSLKAKQQAVGGYIECVYCHDDDTCIIGDEEAKLKHKKGNRYIHNGRDILAGDFIIVGLSEEDFRGLTDEEVEKYLKKYEDAPVIRKEQVEKSIRMGFYGF